MPTMCSHVDQGHVGCTAQCKSSGWHLLCCLPTWPDQQGRAARHIVACVQEGCQGAAGRVRSLTSTRLASSDHLLVVAGRRRPLSCPNCAQHPAVCCAGPAGPAVSCGDQGRPWARRCQRAAGRGSNTLMSTTLHRLQVAAGWAVVTLGTGGASAVMYLVVWVAPGWDAAMPHTVCSRIPCSCCLYQHTMCLLQVIMHMVGS